MPIYEYQCRKCQSLFEEWQSGFEELEVECPECGEQSKRLISHSAFHLKGSGWYADGYGEKKPESTPSKGAADDNGKGDGKGDGKKAKADSGGGDSAPTPEKKSSDASSTDSAS